VIAVGDAGQALFKHVYECQLSGASMDASIFSEHAKPLVEGLLGGVNATIVAYGEVSVHRAQALNPHSLLSTSEKPQVDPGARQACRRGAHGGSECHHRRLWGGEVKHRPVTK